MRFLLLICLFALTSVSLSAQAEVTYRLREPDAEEYLNNVIQIYDDPALHQEIPNYRLHNIIENEIFLRYENIDQVDPQLLLNIYDAMAIGTGYYGLGDRDRWNEHILENWLNQYAIDLSTAQTLAFQDYHIEVTPRDFDADGINEYVLDTIKGQREDFNRSRACGYPAEYVDFVVVKQYGNRYQIVETPLHWYGGREPRFGVQGGVMEIRFEDLNADGLPEWVLMNGGTVSGGPGAGYINNGYLAILSWRDAQLVNLTALNTRVTHFQEDAGTCHGPEPRDVTWEFINLDADPAQEILQHQVYLDNWRCIARQTKVIDWDAAQDRYVQIDMRRDLPYDSQNCARRKAEEAMWASNYTQALQYYEHALTLQPYIDPDETSITARDYYRETARNRRITYDQYHRARMALAYQLTSRPEKARLILETLQTETFSHEPLQYFVEALIQAPDIPFAACLAAHDTFAQHVNRYYDSGYYFGVTVEQDYEAFISYSPARIGCDVRPLVELQTRTLSGDRLPVEHVSDLGLVVRDTLHVDLNRDGEDEWLVWTETPMEPLFFALDDSGHYHVSTPSVNPFNRAVEISTWRLPDDGETAIATIASEYDLFFEEPWACAYDRICGRGGYPYTCSPDGMWYLSFWRMNEIDFTLTRNTFEVCRRDLATLFPDGEGSTLIDGGEIVWEQDASQNRLIRYEWDATTKTFLNAIPNTPVPTVITTATPAPLPKYGQLSEALDAEDYIEALVMLDTDEARNSDYYRDNPNADVLYDYHYQRGFILEMLNRSDEALAEYIAIYEAAPDSAWGMLAALHLEVVETE